MNYLCYSFIVSKQYKLLLLLPGEKCSYVNSGLDEDVEGAEPDDGGDTVHGNQHIPVIAEQLFEFGHDPDLLWVFVLKINLKGELTRYLCFYRIKGYETIFQKRVIVTDKLRLIG